MNTDLGNFAELIGITLGDGSVGNYPRCQYLRIYFNPKQRQYIDYVTSLLIRHFKKSPYELFRKDAGVTFLEISLKNMDKHLGIPAGSKIRNKVKIPGWIWEKPYYLKRCLRGLFDTDGCVYITGGKYKIVDYSSHNINMLEDIYNALVILGFHPYARRTSIELGRMTEVKNFFRVIKPKNDNHYRFEQAEIANVVKARV